MEGFTRGVMIKFLSGFWEETDGSTSNMRLNITIVTIACCVMAIRIVFSEYEIEDNSLYLILGMLATALGNKSLQKFAEVKKEIAEKQIEAKLPVEKTE